MRVKPRPAPGAHTSGWLPDGAPDSRRWLDLLWPSRRTRRLPERVSPAGPGTAGRSAQRPGRGEQGAPPGSRRITRWLKARVEDHRRRLAARAEARAHAPLRPGERLLAAARGADGELAVATDRALYHQDGPSWARLGWEQVDQVRWDEQRHVMTLTGLAAPAPARTLLRLASPWDLPAVASERATWARLVDQRVWLNDRAGARMVARRAPGERSITWLVILDHGLDPADPAVRTALESALADLRAVTGADEAAAE